MTDQPSTIVQRLWNYCNVLRDDGVSYGDYVEQLTYLLFLKIDQEQVETWGAPSAIPAAYNWASLRELSGGALEDHYREILHELGQGSGLIPVIFRKAQNRIQDPAKLRRLIMLIDEEVWTGLDMDVKGEIYEGLLEKYAQDTKSGAGPYFTLKQNPLTRAALDDFVACYNPANRHQRTTTWSEADPEGRWRAFAYDELMARDKANLDIFWIRDESLEQSANLPEPDVLAAEIVEDLEAALAQFRAIAEDLA